MKKLSWKKVGCLLLALLMAATMLATGAMAYDNAANQTGSITIHKYAQNDPGSDVEFPDGKPADGNEITDGESLASLGEALEGVEFTIYNVTNIVTDPANTDAKSVDVSALEGMSMTTGKDGVATFDNLALGLYLVKETKHPDKVTLESDPFFVSIPMTQPDGSDWIYDVHVYPKNAYVLGTVELTKVDEKQSALPDATFALLKWDSDQRIYVPTGRIAISDQNGKVTFDNLIVGKYALQETQAPENYTLRDDLFEFEITRDQQSYTFTDKVVNYKKLDDKAIQKDNSGAEGARYINWTVTANIPGDIGLYKQFSIKDEVPAGLDVAENIVVKVGDNELSSDTDYTLTNGLGDNDDAANDFNIAFTSPFTALKSADKVTIIFKTQIKEGANVGNVLNKATLTFQSKTDKNPTSYSDDANGAIYGIQVEKVNLKGNQLAGAKFDLYYGEDAPDTTADTPVYQDYTTGEDGTITFKGLNPGTYWLVETEAPNGYAKMTKAFKVEVEDTEEDHLAHVTVLNTASFSLPITGGIGTLIFTFSGIALMGAAALLYIRSRKKKATEA